MYSYLDKITAVLENGETAASWRDGCHAVRNRMGMSRSGARSPNAPSGLLLL